MHASTNQGLEKGDLIPLGGLVESFATHCRVAVLPAGLGSTWTIRLPPDPQNSGNSRRGAGLNTLPVSRNLVVKFLLFCQKSRALWNMGSTVFTGLGCGGADRMWAARGVSRLDVGHVGGSDQVGEGIESPRRLDGGAAPPRTTAGSARVVGCKAQGAGCRAHSPRAD